MNKNPYLRWYFRLFQFVAQARLKRLDIDPREVHTQLVVVLSTGVLMWAYAFLAITSISSRVPGIIGTICALIHLLSPFIFRVTNNSYIPANIMLAAGIVHQSSFSYYSGGFDSNVLIWFGILPLIGGVICGHRGALTWFYIASFVSLAFLILKLNHHEFPYLISSSGKSWGQGLLIFGWIFLSSIIIMVYAGLREHTEKKLLEQSQKTDDLFRILFHDLANPLGRIAIGLSIIKKQMPEGENNRGLEIAKSASDAMMEITQNIRKMYAVSKGKANVDLSLISLNSAVEYILKLYSVELAKKKINIVYDFDKHTNLNLMVEPVSFNNQVLGNIVSNAIKFSLESSEVFVNVYRVTDTTTTIEIKDNGIGIPKALIGQLFDINKKTSRPGTSGETGTGFGMLIMKSFVEMYGGQISIESPELPSGTSIKITLKSEWT